MLYYIGLIANLISILLNNKEWFLIQIMPEYVLKFLILINKNIYYEKQLSLNFKNSFSHKFNFL